MLTYEGYGIERVDSLNFRVFKIGNSASETVVKKGVTYHSNLEQSLLKVRTLLKGEAYHNSITNIESAVQKIKEIDQNFMDFLDKLSVKKLAKLLDYEEVKAA